MVRVGEGGIKIQITFPPHLKVPRQPLLEDASVLPASQLKPPPPAPLDSP